MCFTANDEWVDQGYHTGETNPPNIKVGGNVHIDDGGMFSGKIMEIDRTRIKVEYLRISIRNNTSQVVQEWFLKTQVVVWDLCPEGMSLTPNSK